MILRRRIIPTIILIGLGATTMHWSHQNHRASGPMPQQAYIWNRTWTSALRDSIHDSSASFGEFVVLAAEVSFRSGHAEVARVPIDYASLKSAGIPFGLALRIGPRPDGVADAGVQSQLTDLADSLLHAARSAGTSPAELQIDFDCAESRLDGYRIWIESLRQRVAPTAVTITALPSWLSRPAFVPLARETAGYVLQVHSLEPPASSDQPMTLCDASAARRWVQQAATIGVPFRVALPTYGYLVAFDDNGVFRGLAAEGPSRQWPAGTIVRPLSADPAAMAGLVAQWTAARPPSMTGVIWYRLPTSDDALNWRWTTLQTVMAGRVPRALLRAAVVKTEPCLSEVQLRNDGAADAPLTAPVTVRWQGASLVAADALGGFERMESGETGAEPGRIRLVARAAIASEHLAPGQHRAIAWLRLSKDKEVQADVLPIEP